MKHKIKPKLLFLIYIALFAIALSTAIGTAVAQSEPKGSAGLKSPADFESMGDEVERSIALFNEMGKVLQHPRCVNCHPRGDSPLQGMAMEEHEPPVVRGVGNFGAPGMRCMACHGPDNVAYQTNEGSIPGHPRWHLAPSEQAWEGKTLGAICEQLKDEERSHMPLAELQEHNATDTLVGWGWNPGEVALRRAKLLSTSPQQTRSARVRATWATTSPLCRRRLSTPPPDRSPMSLRWE